MKKIEIKNGKMSEGYELKGAKLSVISNIAHPISMEEIKEFATEQGANEIVVYDRGITGVTSRSYALVNGEWKNGFFWGGEFVADSWGEVKK